MHWTIDEAHVALALGIVANLSATVVSVRVLLRRHRDLEQKLNGHLDGEEDQGR